MPCDRPGVAVVARHRLGEPAQRAGAEPAEHDARLPRLAQGDVEPVRAQHAHQADHAAAADVDQVLVEQVRADVVGAAVAAEERDVRGLAAARREVPVEADDVVVGVPGGGGEEADLGPVAPGRRGEAQHVVVEQRVPRLHGEPAPAEGDDLAWTRHGASVGTDPAPRANFVCPVERPCTACRGVRTPCPNPRQKRRSAADSGRGRGRARSALSRRSASAAPARWRRTAACRRTCRGSGPRRCPGSSPRSRCSRRRRVWSSSCLRYITPAWTLSVADAGSSGRCARFCCT